MGLGVYLCGETTVRFFDDNHILVITYLICVASLSDIIEFTMKCSNYD